MVLVIKYVKLHYRVGIWCVLTHRGSVSMASLVLCDSKQLKRSLGQILVLAVEITSQIPRTSIQ